MRKFVLAAALLAVMVSCKDEEKAKDAIDQHAKEIEDKAGSAIDSTVESIKHGVEDAKEEINASLQPDVILNENLKAKGISIGKFTVENDKKGTDNKLVIYIITEKDFNGTLTFKVLDKKGIESGRQAFKLTAKAGEAGYKEVVFDERTNIQNSYTIEIN